MHKCRKNTRTKDIRCTSVYESSMESNDKIAYCDEAMMFVTPMRRLRRYLLYQEGVRVSRSLVIKFYVGHGVYHTFVNRIQLFRYNGIELRMVKQKDYRHFCWNERDITKELILLVEEYCKGDDSELGCPIALESERRKFAEEMVENVRRVTVALGEGFFGYTKY